jgi:hypothetical protein
MLPLTINDLAPLDTYANSYKEARQRIIQVKARRRVTVGKSVAFLFENRETLLYQIQEMIRVEHITEPDKIQDELDTYNALLPQPGELSATMFIQITDQEKLIEQLDMFMGIDQDDVAVFRFGSKQISGTFESGHSKEDKISAVHFVRFQVPNRAVAILQDPQYATTLNINHPNYQAETALSQANREALLGDLLS